MSARFTEIDWRETPMGAISLRRKTDATLAVDVYEVKLGDEFLMSSLFTVAEIELARLGLAQQRGDALDVVVGGLGLGYTAREVLHDPRVNSLIVVEALGEVIEWHQRELLPMAGELTSDPRTRLVRGDFFAMAGDRTGFDPDAPDRLFHVILLDIDHTPRYCCIQVTPRFTRPMVCAGWLVTCIQEGCSRSRPTIHPMTTSAPCLPRFSPPPMLMW